MKKIYIVVGSTGEYSDHREWFVKAYADKKKAKKMVENCTSEYLRVHALVGDKYYERGDKSEYVNKYDPEMDIDYTGTNYNLAEIGFEE